MSGGLTNKSLVAGIEINFNFLNEMFFFLRIMGYNIFFFFPRCFVVSMIHFVTTFSVHVKVTWLLSFPYQTIYGFVRHLVLFLQSQILIFDV